MEVATHYSVDGLTLTQIVEASSDTVYPVVADPWLGVDLISSFKWWTHSGKPAISVSVTPMMAAVNTAVAGNAGWTEIRAKVKAKSASKSTEMNKATYKQQWYCHAAGKTLIGVGGWLGIDKKPTWDLEGSRGTVSDPVKLVSSRCNW